MVDKLKSKRRRQKSGGDMCCLLIEARNTYPDDYDFLVTLADFLSPTYNTILSPPYDKPGVFGNPAQKASGIGLYGYLMDFYIMATQPEKYENVQRFLGTLVFEIESTVTGMYACSGRGVARRYCVNNNMQCDQYCSLITNYMYRLFTIRYFTDFVRLYGHIALELLQPIVNLQQFYTSLSNAPLHDAMFISEMAVSHCTVPAIVKYASDIADTDVVGFTAQVACTSTGCLVWDFSPVRYLKFYLTYDIRAIARLLKVFYRLGQLGRYLIANDRKDSARVLLCWAAHASIDAGEVLWHIVDDYMRSRNLWGSVTIPIDLIEVVVRYTPLAALLNVYSYSHMSEMLARSANQCFSCPWGELMDYRDLCGAEGELPYAMETVQCLDYYEQYFARYGYTRPNLPPINPTIIRRIYMELRRAGAPIIPPLPGLIAIYST